MPDTLTRRHMKPLEQAGSPYGELMRFIDQALVRASPAYCSVLVDGLLKGHHEHDPSRLIGDLERAVEPVAAAVHAPVRDEVSGGIQSMPKHRRLVGEFIALPVHEQAIPVAQVHVVAHHLTRAL